ncbi:MAG: bifunctional diaminohydroxyphosphoribosylaminopyrimidine deaminase/5-amino-6-(5-phosphoribosylamino)uracil reductase RibD [Prevotella sp.]
MSQTTKDEMYMRRCLQLAACGFMNARPNPMVGAVIVCGDRIIGEGYHVRCGEGHAEVNAFASVSEADTVLLPRSTVYVSLEPCAHYGKTPPCADLIVRKGVRRVVVGCTDPFAKVSGRGIQRIREAGIDVTVGVLEKECLDINRRFITFHSKGRPYILLKWAQTADGFIDDHGHALAISSPFTKMLVHKLRAESDAILVGRITDEREHPQLNVRLWSGRSPRRIVLGHGTDLRGLLATLHDDNVQSLMVEGGAVTLRSFIDAGLWDEIRVETSGMTVGGGTPAPRLPENAVEVRSVTYDNNRIDTFRHVMSRHD